MLDPYVDPRSQVLRNILGINNQVELDKAETQNVAIRATFLNLNPIEGNFDSSHLKAIHCYLFRDIYIWAGQVRTTDLAKAEYDTGGWITKFTDPSAIDTQLQMVLGSAPLIEQFQDLSRSEFVTKVAVLFASLNAIHPFREGNGRAIRHFIRQLANACDHKLDFSIISKERMIRACVNAAKGDLGMIERMMDEISDPILVESASKLIKFLETQKFSWNDHYLAATVTGQSYSGIFAGSDGKNFFFRDDSDQILIGNAADLPKGVNHGDRIQFIAS